MNTALPYQVDCDSNMTTFTGRYVNPWKMEPKDVDIRDIAHGLSNICRFSGQCKVFYSVAQHSTLCGWAVMKETGDRKLALIALLHDAPEAYASDLVRCVKARLPDYKDLEYGIWVAVIRRFKLEPLISLLEDGEGVNELPEPVKVADMRMLVTERKYLISEKSAVWDLQKTYEPYPISKIHSEHPGLAKKNFMFAFTTFAGESMI